MSNYKGQVVQNIWIDIPIVNPMAKEQRDFQTQKPEALLERIIKCCTKEGDLVLDYHIGSGTTSATAHKLGRKYIGVEQMDYLNEVTIPRLVDVINGDEYGISPEVNWQGGGSFVYCELAKLNQAVVEQIEAAKDDETLLNIWEKMRETGFISYKVNPVDIDAAAEDFLALSMENKKHFLMELLDKNLLYVNYCDMDDREYAVSETDKAFTRSFYREA